MARPGDPYETERLDDLRSAQRRKLRAIDADLLVSVAHATSGSAKRDVPWFEALRLETELREIIDREMVHLDDVLTRTEQAVTAAMTAAFLHDVAPRNGESGDEASTGVGAIDELADELSATAHRIAIDGLSHRERVALERFILLAIWADQLAGDYTDPRLVPG